MASEPTLAEAGLQSPTERALIGEHATIAKLRALVDRGETVIGPDSAEWSAGARTLFPDAAVLGQVAGRRNDFLPAEKLEPIYLREIAFVKAPARAIPARSTTPGEAGGPESGTFL